MPYTAIADLWVPDIWIRGTNERANSLPSVINSGIAVRNAEFDTLATGAGTSVNVPFFKDITDQDDEIQVPDTAPTVNKNTAGVMVAPVLNRVTANGVQALAAAVSGDDPVGFVTGKLAERRLKQRQKTLLAILRGCAATALADVRNDQFIEDGDAATAVNLVDSPMVIDTFALLGELQNDLLGGAMLAHPNIRAALLKQDENNFERKSEGAFIIERYKGIPLYVSNHLVRAGATSGFVYDTYFIAAGVVAQGDKPQMGDVIDVASLQFDTEKGKNNQVIYDRTRFLMHLNGLKWVGNPAGQSASNAELQTAANWQLVYQTPDRVGVTCLQTNG